MWDTVGAKRYYYRSQWAGGRTRRLYVGCGSLAELAAALDEQERAERQDERDAWTATQTECDLLLQPALDLNDHTNHLAAAVLYAAGCHRPQRRWRHRLDRPH